MIILLFLCLKIYVEFAHNYANIYLYFGNSIQNTFDFSRILTLNQHLKENRSSVAWLIQLNIWWSFFPEMIKGSKALTVLAKTSILRVWLGSGCTLWLFQKWIVKMKSLKIFNRALCMNFVISSGFIPSFQKTWFMVTKFFKKYFP